MVFTEKKIKENTLVLYKIVLEWKPNKVRFIQHLNCIHSRVLQIQRVQWVQHLQFCCQVLCSISVTWYSLTARVFINCKVCSPFLRFPRCSLQSNQVKRTSQDYCNKTHKPSYTIWRIYFRKRRHSIFGQFEICLFARKWSVLPLTALSLGPLWV